jgi:hypothetical protein
MLTWIRRMLMWIRRNIFVRKFCGVRRIFAEISAGMEVFFVGQVNGVVLVENFADKVCGSGCRLNTNQNQK